MRWRWVSGKCQGQGEMEMGYRKVLRAVRWRWVTGRCRGQGEMETDQLIGGVHV